MSAAQWDTANLPIDRLFSVQTGYVDNAITTEFDSGRVESIQRGTKNRRVYSVSYNATPAQVAIFQNWYENTLGGNAGHFTAPSLRDGGATTQEYRFDGTPDFPSGGYACKTIVMTWVEV